MTTATLQDFSLAKLISSLRAAMFWCVLLLCITYLMSEQANADQKAYVQQLEKLLATCLGDKEGALFIGGELYLCKAVNTGIKQ